MKNSFLAFVPARGGSKSIPKKNLSILGGKPLISHTLDICRSLDDISTTLVSTDDEEIAALCTSEGFHTDYRRPKDLASDEAGMIETILHGVDWYERHHHCEINHILLLQPTSPLRRLEDVRNALKYYDKENLSSLMSIIPMHQHPYECVELTQEDSSWSYLKQPIMSVKRRQDYRGKFGFIDGSIYIFSTESKKFR